MTYSQMKDYFLILQDKFGSPYYTDDEVTLFLNRAQLDTVIALLPLDGNPINVELNQNTIDRIAPLVFTNTAAVMNSSGWVNKEAFNTLHDIRLLRVLAISYNGKPAKATRWNNWAKYVTNVFKVPSADYPRYAETALNWIFKPIDITAVIDISGIRYPVEMLADGSIDCELPDFTHNDVVSRALELAGVGSRDQMLSELKQLNKV
jgi:hypothetical protein